uniref:CPBP family intramembrane glutamic endopeptidase n=1 Tax=Nonomuraea pusilla TaxID=46177 RepID=UPI0006E42347|nr:CPBP family intramembrane glutamic endopeptidase [Nonomuraea pusilla]
MSDHDGPAPARGVRAWVRRRPVTSFFALAYAFSWSWWWGVAATGGLVRPGVAWPTHLPGLLGPALAAVAVTAAVDGRRGVSALLRRVPRQGGARGAALALSPLALLAVAVVAARVVDGRWPVWTGLTAISGLPRDVLPMLAGLVLVNGVGEETGWRGFAQERLQDRHGPLRAALLVTAGWCVWHLPLFVIVTNYRGFPPAAVPAFVLGMAAGAVVLACCYNTAMGGIGAAAVWHAAYNLASASAMAEGTIAAVTTTLVMVWAAALLVLARRDRRRGRPSPLWGGRRPPAAVATAVSP